MRRKIGLILLGALCADWLAYVLWPFVSSDAFADRSIAEIRATLREQTAPDRTSPPAKQAGKYTIGVFGGSMAKMLGDVWATKWEASPAAVELSKRVGRPLQILNLAIMAGSEPQQYNLLHLLHDRLDAAVFVDGFNEMFRPQRFVNGRNGCDAMHEFWQSNRKTESELLQPVVARYAELHALSNRWWIWYPLRFSALFKYYLYKRSTTFFDGVAAYLHTFDSTRLSSEQPPSPRERADAWAACAVHATELARSLDLPIFLFLQPNLHIEGSKAFTADEEALRREGGQRGDYGSIPDGYRAMTAHITELRRRGIPIEDLTGVFGATTPTVYVDACCHVNDLGSQVMIDTIARAMLQQNQWAGPQR